MGNSRCCSDDFSEDIFIEILMWLPVVSLLRFKSVCKSWRALIENPLFIDLHTNTPSNSNSSSKFGSFILHAFIPWRRKQFMLSSGSGSGSGDDDIIIDNDDEEEEEAESRSRCGNDDIIIIDNENQEEKEAENLGFPPCVNVCTLSFFNVGMVGSCNGLICIYNHRERFATLWNPATRQFRILPKSIPIKEKDEDEVMCRFSYDFVAFGFDVKTKDYKVVMFSCFTPSYLYRRIGVEVFCVAQVYCLSTDSWRLLEDIKSLPNRLQLPSHQNQGIYMNGCYFFVGKDESQLFLSPPKIVCNNSFVYSFDFTKEILTTVQCPDHDSRHDLILGYIGEKKMALFVIQRNLLIGGGSEFHDCGLDYEYYDIWVLNDEQPGSGNDGFVVNKESWTKLHSFPKINRFKHPSQPRCISSNGEFALISTRAAGGSSDLQLFNLVTKEAKKFLTNDYNIFRSDAYKQSLVSIIGGNGAAPTIADRVVDCST